MSFLGLQGKLDLVDYELEDGVVDCFCEGVAVADAAQLAISLVGGLLEDHFLLKEQQFL